MNRNVTIQIYKKILLLILTALLFLSTVYADDNDPCTPFQVALWHPAQIFDERYDVTGFRLNLFYGKNKYVTGIDLGLLNLSYEERGIQFGAVNFIDNNSYGIQIGSFINVSNHYGIKISSFINLGFGIEKGFHLSMYNESGEFYGLQAGFVNLVHGASGGFISLGHGNSTVKGMQMAVLINQSIYIKGLQLGLYNFTVSDIYGTQVGFINRADRVKGCQIGVINYAVKMSGIQIGLVNIIKEGMIPILPFFNASMSFDM